MLWQCGWSGTNKKTERRNRTKKKRKKNKKKEGKKKEKKKEKQKEKTEGKNGRNTQCLPCFCSVSCAQGMTSCLTLKGCASHTCHCAESNVQCTSMACGWCVAQTLLLTRVAKTTSTWRTLSRKCLINTLKTVRTHPSRSTSAVVHSLPNGLPSSPAQARHSDLCTNYKQFGLKAITSQIEKPTCKS